MKIKSVLFAAMVLCLVTCSPRGAAQYRLVVLSPRVGAAITGGERSQFGLFPGVAEFGQATLYRRLDSTFAYLIILQSSKPGTTAIVLTTTSAAMCSTAERIDHYEGLADGSYIMGTKPVVLESLSTIPVDGDPFRPGERGYVASEWDRLPLAGPVDGLERLRFLTPEFGLGVEYRSFKADGLFAVQTSAASGSALMFVLGAYLPLASRVSLGMEAGMGSPLVQGSAFIQANLPLHRSGDLSLLAGAGVTFARYSSSEGLIIHMGGTGLYLTAGVRFKVVACSVDFFTMESKQTVFEGKSASLDLSGLSFNMKLLF
jgi:hypothetical protein